MAGGHSVARLERRGDGAAERTRYVRRGRAAPPLRSPAVSRHRLRAGRRAACRTVAVPAQPPPGAASARKGDVIGIARIAAIQAAKRTAELIPLCHPLPLTRVAAEFELLPGAASEVRLRVTAETVGPTGVEMEALTAVQVGLLTVYDMCKAVDRAMVIDGVRLLEKHGGKSGSFVADAGPGGG